MMPDRIDDLVTRGDKYMDSGLFYDAFVQFEKALAIDDSDPDLWNRAGVALRSLGRYVESTRYFEQSLRIDPRDRDSS